jgi:choline dehydrogenase-like flavoprotein
MAFTEGGNIPRDTTLTTDVCIVGGGPSGIAVALRLIGSGLDVVLLESGGEESGGEAQSLNEGENVGLPYFDLDRTRFRGLGGNSNHWAGWCRPLEAIDMEAREWVPLSGWPLTLESLDPYYREAGHLCQLEVDDFAATADDGRLPPLYRPPFVGGDVRIATWRGSPPTKFGAVYRSRLESDRRFTVITEATAVSVSTDAHNGRATGVHVKTLAGNQFDVAARAVVLCAGAMETARLLLVSAPGGLGNEHDLVGRHFMEHPHVVTGLIELAPGTERTMRLPALDRGLLGARARLQLLRPTGASKVAYVLAEERIRREGLLAFAGHFQTIGPGRDSDAYEALKLVIGNLRSPRRLLRQIRTRSLSAGPSRQMGRVVTGLPVVLRAVYHEVLRRPRRLALYTQAEQSPNPDSRVMLDPDRRDALGVPRLRLEWRLSSLDKRSIIRSQEILADRLATTGVGRLDPTEAFCDDSPDWGGGLGGGHHHLGTARMATDPRRGVVDPHQRVHSVPDLYVGDSAVFPTGGFANPMLTTVALALRLGDHLAVTYRR